MTAGALRPLARSLLARPAPVVARELLGRLLVGGTDDAPRIARIVECEAYEQDDPASHSYRGRTGRTEVMFGPAGHLYVYFTYGMHYCMNVVTGRAGEGSAVLLRAAEPLEGQDRMAESRGLRAPYDPRLLCSGPARLTQAFGVTREENALDLLGGGTPLGLTVGVPVPDGDVGVSTRIGIRAGRERPWRFFVSGSPFVSRGPRELTPRGSPR